MSERPAKRMKQSSLLDCFREETLYEEKLSGSSVISGSVDIAKSVKTSCNPVTTSVATGDVCDTLVPSSSSDVNNMLHAASPQPTVDCRNAAADTAVDSTDQMAQYSMSPELFTDSESGSSQNSQVTAAADTDHSMTASRSSGAPHMLGTPLSELKRAPQCSCPLPPLKASPSHTVLYKLPHAYSDTQPPSPHPSCYDYKADLWDGNHVRMPCSHRNEYPVDGKAVRRWDIIEKALLQDIKNTVQLQDAILTYNARYSKRWDFSALHRLFLEELPATKTREFFEKTFKDMVKLALQLPHLCTQPIPLLRTGHCHSLTLSQQQGASLLANAFFCTFPRRNAHHKNSEYASYPNINFNGLFAGGQIPRKVQKLKAIIHYFTRVTQCMPTGCLTFRRQCLPEAPDWDNSDKCLPRLHVRAQGAIEKDGRGMLQVDFANKYLGGGVLGHGCVQEEIRFLICPEMILSKLFTEVLDNNETLVMSGCERFSDYTGYASTFAWSSDHQDSTPRDDWGRLLTEVVAMDALVVRDYGSQFKMWAVRRELNKAYCGFKNFSIPPENIPAVCTGNWGCGAFGGDKRLKALLQMMAASMADRDVFYLTFDDDDLCRDLHTAHQQLSGLSISDIMLYIQQYYRNVCLKSRGRPLIHIYDYITMCIQGNINDSDDEDSMSEVTPTSNPSNVWQSKDNTLSK